MCKLSIQKVGMVIDLNKNMKDLEIFTSCYVKSWELYTSIFMLPPQTDILLFVVPSVKFQSNDMSCLRNLKQSLINAKCEEVLKKLK